MKANTKVAGTWVIKTSKGYVEGYVRFELVSGEVFYTDKRAQALKFSSITQARVVAKACGGKVFRVRSKVKNWEVEAPKKKKPASKKRKKS